MVTPSSDRRAYVGSSAGAPPPPPPGGYRGARRVPLPPPVEAAPDPRPAPSVLSWIALVAAALFALVLLVLWGTGATSAIYAVGTLAVQLAVAIAVVAALTDPRGRRLGGIALALVLVVNIGTIGAASAIGGHPTPESVAAPDPADDYWAAYPGIQGQTTEEILARPSLEEVQRLGDELLAAIRERLTAEFDVDWVEGVPGGIRPERNGYGGESMLVQYLSSNWATTTPVADYDLKLEMMAAIDEVLAEYGWWYLFSFNDPSSGFDPAYLERLYGSTDPRTQPVWEWYSDNEPDPMRLYATLTDLSLDDDGTFRAAREAQVAGTAEPLEGLRIMVLVPEVLSEADVEEFLDRMEDY